MVIGAAHQNSRLLHANFFDKLKILLAGAYPACDLRKLIALFHTLVDGVPVLFTVQKKFTGTNHAVGTSQTVEIIIYRHNLLRRIRSPRLLAVPESCIGYPDISGHIMRYNPVVKRNLWYFRIREHISEHIGLFHIVQYIHMFFNFQQVIFRVQRHRPVHKKSVFFSHHLALRFL